MNDILIINHKQEFVNFYDNWFKNIMLDRVPTDCELDFLIDCMNVKPGDYILDQGSGVGSISIPLAQRGYKITGVDLVQDYVLSAQKQADLMKLEAKYYQDDCARFKSEKTFDAIFSWWTSWGHGQTDQENIEIFQSAFDLLKNKGNYVLDWMNLPSILSNFQPERVIKKIIPDLGEVVIERECQIDLSKGLLWTNWRFILKDGQTHEKTTRMKMYMPYQIYSFLTEIGFKSVKLYGDLNKCPLEINHHRMIAVASK